jgi:GNAT superfamily N-acetyltransferase
MVDELVTRSVQRDEVTPELLERVAALLHRAFDGWPDLGLSVSATDHLKWKMNGVLPELPAGIIAELDGRLASYRTLLGRRVLVKQEPKLFLHFVDAAVEPELQGRGVNRAMQQMMDDDFHGEFDLSIDDSSNRTIVRGRGRLGIIHEFGNPVRPYVLPLDAHRFVQDRSSKRMPLAVAAALLRIASIATRLVSRRGRGSDETCSVRTIDGFDARFDEFCAEAIAPFAFVAERTAAFLNWRYADPRGGDFTIRVAERDGQLLGYLVTRTGAELARVADILAAPDEAWVASVLLRDAVDAAREAGSAAVTCWLPERHPYRSALRSMGFVVLRRTTPLVYRAAAMPDEELAFLRERRTSMHLTEGDTDFI